MILSAAAAHRILVEHAQARRGFAGVENARLGAGNRVHKFARQGSDSAQPLQEVQNHALAGKNDARVVADHRNRLAVVQANAVENLRMAGDFVVRSDGSIEHRINIQNARHAADSGENAILLGDDGSGRALAGIDAGIAGRVAGGAIFQQRVLDNGRNAATVPVHKLLETEN